MDELRDIERLAKAQFEGRFSTESDARTALVLIERLAQAMQRLRDEAGFA